MRKAQVFIALIGSLAVAGLLVAETASSRGGSGPCTVSVRAPRHIAPQGVAGRASVRCSGPESKVVLRVEVLRGRARVAARTSSLQSPRARRAYAATAHTAKCVSRPPVPYATQAILTVGGRKLVWRSRRVVIACNRPADNRCHVTASPPVVMNDDLVAPAQFRCASDRSDLIWQVLLQQYDGSTWQNDGSQTMSRQTSFKGGRTYSEAVHQACANEVGPWPESLRTDIELKRRYGPTITTTSQTASLTCPNQTSTLMVEDLSPTGGSVTSAPAGIDCPADCSHPFPSGTHVTLTATAAPGFQFVGWNGDCSGTASTCTLTLDTDKTAIATFHRQGPPPGYREQR